MNPYYEEIVVGSSLRALLFASEREIPIFFTEPEKPFEFELFMPSVDLSSMRLHNGPLHWRTPKDNVTTGGSKIALWEHLLFILGLKGLVPFSNLCSSLRFDDNILTGHSDYAKLRSINFGVCYYFDEHATYNLLACEDNPRIYHTYDRLAFIRGGKHHLDLIQSEELFCNKVWFYPTPRIDGKSSIKDACVFSILSEEHFEEERKIYTRIGMPLMDYEAILEEGIDENANQDMNPESIHHWAANRISDEYALLRILDSEEAHAHLYGDIHVHMLRYFDLRPFCQEWDPRMILEHGLPPVDSWAHCNKSGPAGSLRVAVTHLAKWLGIIQGEFSGGQGYDYITTFLAPFAKDLSEREVEQSMQCLIYETNQIFAARGGQVPFTSISCTPTIPDGLLSIPAVGPYGKLSGNYGDYKEECLLLFDAITKVYTEGDYNGKLFAFPKHEVKIKKEWLEQYEESYLKVMEEAATMGTPYFLNMCPDWMPDEIHSQCCRKFLSGNQIISKCILDPEKRKIANVWENYVTIGSLQSVSLNLPRYAYLSKTEEDYFTILDEKMELSARILRKKWDLMDKLKKGRILLL